MDAFEPYLTQLNSAQRARMEEVLAWVLDTFPMLEPKIAWNQPMFTDHGTFIIGFSVSKHHLAVAPERAGMVHFEHLIEKAGHDHTSLLVRFPWARPVDYALLEKMIEFNMQDKADCTSFWRK